MKKMIPLLLVLFLLSGCGLTDQAAIVKERYVDPAIDAANGGDFDDGGSYTGPNVQTDRSKLTEYSPVETVGSRQKSGAMTELEPSDDYGRLIPYVGAQSSTGYHKYGLVTADGSAVLDPILSVAHYLEYENVGGRGQLDILALGKQAYSGDEQTLLYAAAGGDGSWVTDFEYVAVLPIELGALCIKDLESYSAVCYDSTGNVVFNTASFYNLGSVNKSSILTLTECSEGFMKIEYTNGQYGYMDRFGMILNRSADMASFFDETRPFSEGFAAVKLFGNWNYLGTDGSYAVYANFSEAKDFHNGVAAVKREGVWQIINTQDHVVMEFPGAADVTNYDGYVEVTAADGSKTYYASPTLTELDLYGKELHIADDGYWVVGTNGVRLRTYGGDEMYFSGAVSLLACSGDGYYIVELADGSCAVMDRHSRVTVSAQTLAFGTDWATGELYVQGFSDDGPLAIYSCSGTLVASDAITLPADGYVMCLDNHTSGIKSGRNEWVFRTKFDSGD